MTSSLLKPCFQFHSSLAIQTFLSNSKIVDKIDKNGDGEVTEEELKEWIQYVQRRYIITDTERMWKDHEPESDDTLTWQNYQKRTFGYTDGEQRIVNYSMGLTAVKYAESKNHFQQCLNASLIKFWIYRLWK